MHVITVQSRQSRQQSSWKNWQSLVAMLPSPLWTGTMRATICHTLICQLCLRWNKVTATVFWSTQKGSALLWKIHLRCAVLVVPMFSYHKQTRTATSSFSTMNRIGWEREQNNRGSGAKLLGLSRLQLWQKRKSRAKEYCLFHLFCSLKFWCASREL